MKPDQAAPSVDDAQRLPLPLIEKARLPAPASKPSRKILRRLEKIDELGPRQQATLLRTIERSSLRGAAK